ncbi:gap junction delta-2 protein-like [Oncorhynchus kisutch]|uniref:gap junction delta-2 protein-like n=1 Tax=Oncorhynchus kisutch TaxID=8019 RepID=UPI0012DDB1A0|nr:gap junction delta-2 protein-like [Oncorhynchus kisutch]
MTEWTLLKRLLDAVHQHSTMIGRLWLTVMVIFRLLIIAVATEDVYADEQEMFVCNTLQPGCATVCYDAFAPISQPRFWVFHIISVSTSVSLFIIYTWHNLSKLPQGHSGQEAFNRSCDSDSCSIRSHRHLGHSLANVLEGITAQSQSLLKGAATTTAVLSKYYVFHVCFRALLEVGFVMAQWFLFGFRVPVHLLCKAPPCTQPVDCYVSRPTEKTIFLLFMFCVGLFCILLNLLELNHLGWKKIRHSVRLREGGSWGNYGVEKGGPSQMSSLGLRDVTSTTLLPNLDLVVDHRPDWTCAGNCSPFNKDADAGIETELQLPNNQELQRGETQLLKSKGKGWKSKLRSTEVWI